MGIDWTALGEEAVDLVRRYLMIDTTNPPGNEIDDDRVEVTVTGEPKAPNLSPPDTELYKALADTIQRRADPPSRLRPPALLRGARLPPGSHAHRPGTLLLHVLHVPRPADALPRGPFRPARGARQRRRPGAPPGAREDRRAARLRPDGVGGARLEHALDPLLPEARREAPARVDPHPSRRRAAPPPRGRPRAVSLKASGG